MQPTPVFLLGEPSWKEEPGGLHPQGRKESDMTGDLACAYIYIRSKQSVLKKINSEYSSNIHWKD